MLHTTTLGRIRGHKPCVDGWKKLLAGLGYTNGAYNLNHAVTLADIARINGPMDAIWTIRAFDFNDDFKQKLNILLGRFVERAAAAAADAADRAADAYAAYAAYAADRAAERKQQENDIIEIFGGE